MLERVVRVINQFGIHARPSGTIVKIASKYPNKITLYYEENKANAKSIIETMMLAMPEGAYIRVEVEGNDSENALNDICNALTKNYEY
ncbi:MAG: HPr family phosphocarrier protein [Methanothrix sp.]|jgi:phosphocarrier protein|nr:HPr family phosphocarrier protein [Methanothrix sp.]